MMLLAPLGRTPEAAPARSIMVLERLKPGSEVSGVRQLTVPAEALLVETCRPFGWGCASEGVETVAAMASASTEAVRTGRMKPPRFDSDALPLADKILNTWATTRGFVGG